MYVYIELTQTKSNNLHLARQVPKAYGLYDPAKNVHLITPYIHENMSYTCILHKSTFTNILRAELCIIKNACIIYIHRSLLHFIRHLGRWYLFWISANINTSATWLSSWLWLPFNSEKSSGRKTQSTQGGALAQGQGTLKLKSEIATAALPTEDGSRGIWATKSITPNALQKVSTTCCEYTVCILDCNKELVKLEKKIDWTFL